MIATAFPTAVVAEPTRRLITVAEFEAMIAANVWPEDERIELLDGELMTLSPINLPHALALTALTEILSGQLNRRGVVWSQNPIQLNDGSRPQPDLCVLRPPLGTYAKRLPQAADVLLLVEISDTSLRYDRDTKLPRYALAGVAEVWIVDLTHAQVTTYAQPQGGQYAAVTTYERGQTLAPLALPDVKIATNEVLES